MKRFWDKVSKTSSCWEWTACKNNKGYGYFMLKRGHSCVLAHRFAWALTYGEIPKGICVLHKCDNPICVNPEHLFLGTKKDNTQDMLRKGRNKCGRFPGESHPMAKLDLIKVKQIRHLYFAERRRAQELAEYYQVSRSAINDLLSGRTWAAS